MSDPSGTSEAARVYSGITADLLFGILDVLYHMGGMLEFAGVYRRDQLVWFMAEVQRDIDVWADKEGLAADDPARTRRKWPAEHLRLAFLEPHEGERNFTVVPGGLAQSAPPAPEAEPRE